MKKKLLITRPRYDLTTNYLYHWSTKVIKTAKEKGVSVLDLHDDKATKADLTDYTHKNKPSVIFLNGHGNSITITGQEGDTLISVNDQVNILKGAVVYARSCDSARRLGKWLVANGTKAFLGYRNKFIFAYTEALITTPLRDSLAKLFLEPSNLVPESLIKGNATMVSFRRSQKAMRRNLRFMLSSDSSDLEESAAPYLWSNINSQQLIGDESVAI